MAWPVFARLRELFKLDEHLYEVVVFGAEPYPNYNEILLSPVLPGEQTLTRLS
jgi:nitrite reductase (NADH) large subunit